LRNIQPELIRRCLDTELRGLEWEVNTLNKVRLILAVLVVLSGAFYSSSSSYKSSSAASDKQIAFSVKISDLGLQNNSLARGKQPTEWIEVHLPGQLYDPAKRFGPVTRKAANWTTPIDAAIADFSAFKADDANWILHDFVTQEKDAVSYVLNDKVTREKNRTLFKDRAERYVTGEANYKDYVFVFVRDTGQEHPSPLTFALTGNGYKRTNALSGDETFDVVFSPLRNGKSFVH
jgi:hypothetical protein